MAGVSGDFDKLRKVIGSMKGLKANGARRVTKQLALETQELVFKCFDLSRDVYGVSWKPIRYRVGKILEDTRRLKNSINSTMTGNTGFMIHTNAVYARIHNFGGEIEFKARVQFGHHAVGRIAKAGQMLPAGYKKHAQASNPWTQQKGWGRRARGVEWLHGGKYLSNAEVRRLTRAGKFDRIKTSVAQHNARAIYIPRRQFIPNAGYLPRAWEERLRKAATLVLVSLLK